jgi:DNA-binding IclR family transcriptional regulator
MGSPDRPVVEAVLRAMRLLDCFEEGEPELPLMTFVRRGGYSKTTTHRLLNTLTAAGWLERTADSRFRLTMRSFQIGSILIESLDIRRVAPPIMTRLSIESQQTIYLMVPAGTHAVCLERMTQGARIRVLDLEVGGSRPLNVGGAPRALLAYNENLLPALLRAGLTGRTPASLTDEHDLRTDLARIRERGYSISDEDSTDGVAAIGTPVFDGSEQAVAALSLGGLRDDILPPRQAHVDALIRAADDISERLGSRQRAAARAVRPLLERASVDDDPGGEAS